MAATSPRTFGFNDDNTSLIIVFTTLVAAEQDVYISLLSFSLTVTLNDKVFASKKFLSLFFFSNGKKNVESA